jgi:hypothetical protein
MFRQHIPAAMPALTPARVNRNATHNVRRVLKEMEHDTHTRDAYDLLVLLEKDMEYAARRGHLTLDREAGAYHEDTLAMCIAHLKTNGYKASVCVEEDGKTMVRVDWG